MDTAGTQDNPELICGVMFRQPALASSAFAGLHDELLAYWTLFCSTEDLLKLSEVNSVFYVFANEDALWMSHCLRRHGGDFAFHHNWRTTTFFPRVRPQGLPCNPPLPMRGFGSDFLYRRWYRSHMNIKDYVPPIDDPMAKPIRKMDVKQISYQEYYEQYASVPFIIQGATTKWKASTEWTMEKLAARFPQEIKHRLTHNLDFFGSEKSTQMSFADYADYMREANDETPLYVFDARMGEKMPELLGDYNVDDLRFFQEDMLSVMTKNLKEKEQNGAAEEARTMKYAAPRPNRPDFRWIVIGPQRSGAPWHTDPARTSAWNALVKGRKRWALYPPNCPPPGISVGKNAYGRQHALGMTSLYWYLHVYPTLQPHERPYEVIQEEGETIYVPTGWWHLVLNLEETIAVTQNFVDPHNFMPFLEDLLGDQQDDSVHRLQSALCVSRPETKDIFRLALMGRTQGYLSQSLYLSSFGILEYWKSPIKKILTRYQARTQKKSSGDDAAEVLLSVLKNKRVPRMKMVTSRANPTIAVGQKLIIKFFSQLNLMWNEFDFSTFLAPNFQATDSDAPEAEPSSKRAKHAYMQPHELRQNMSLRDAIEECYRIESSTYKMITAAVFNGQNAFLEPLLSWIPKFYDHGHVHHVDDVDDEDGEGRFWRWPYVVIEYKRGFVGLDKLESSRGGGATQESWLQAAKWISEDFLPRLHAVPIDPAFRGIYGQAKADWDWYLHYLTYQRKRAIAFHLKENALPPQLMRQLEQFLPAANADAILQELLPANTGSSKPVLLHGDLTDENIMGVVAKSSVVSRGATTDLTAHLESIGCGKYVPLLVQQEELTLESLDLLTEDHLKQLGLPLGPRLAILGAKSRIAKVIDSDEDEDVTSEEEWETTSSSSSEDEEELPLSTEARLAKFTGPQQWTPRAVIDFADSKTGDPLYDLVAVFFSALHCDRALWKATLAAPYWQVYIREDLDAAALASSARPPLRERFLKLVLLHTSRSIKTMFYVYPHAYACATWEDLANLVFGDVFELSE